MSAEFSFTDEEILRQLQSLGFENVSEDQLRVFKTELQRLVQEEAEGKQEIGRNVSKSTYSYGRHHGCDNSSVAETNLKLPNADTPVYQKPSYVLVEKLPPVRHVTRLKSDWTPSHFDDYDRENISPTSSTSSSSSCRSISVNTMSSGASSICNTPGSAKETSSECSAALRSRPRKRKVLRKKNGTSYICDETTCSSDGSLTHSGYRMASVGGKGSARSSSLARIYSDKPKPPTNVGHVCKKWRSTSDLGSENRAIYKPKSVILPYSNQLQAQNYFKTDPVALYHYYKKEWTNHNIPGERDHRELRWNIRTMMSLKDIPTRSQSRSSLAST